MSGAADDGAGALRLLIVDDEPLARLRLAALVRDCPQPRCAVAGEAGSAAQALQWLASQACDAVLLDIQMPGQRGTEVVAEMRRRLPGPLPAVVFVTAHADHALQAFELDAVDYLTKPVRRERLHEALQRVAQRLAPRAGPAAAAAEVPVLVVSERGRVLRIPVTEVLYLKAELKYVTLRTAAHSHVLDDSLTELESRLPQHFLRVHRNALVARQAMRALERRVIPGSAEDEEGAESWAVQVAPLGEWLAVSRRQVAAVREAMAAAR